MEIYDISHWKKNELLHAPGTREKYWLHHPDDKKLYLFKIPRENTGEAWAEKIASEVGSLLDFPVLNVNLAKFYGKVGMLSANFLENGEELFEGGDLLTSYFTGYDRFNLDGYNIEKIMLILKRYGLHKDFIFIPIFDALIGNQDRHCDNWGIIRGRNGFKLAPAYDNGPSLGCLESKTKIMLRLRDRQSFQAFTNRSFTRIGIGDKKRPNHLLLLKWIKDHYPAEFRKNIQALDSISKTTLVRICESVPYHIMEERYKEWVVKLLLYRRDWILHWYQKEGGQ